MKYTLRNFQNNFQAAASVGWILVIMSIVFFMLKMQRGMLTIAVVGLVLILWQQRGKRVLVDTKERIIRAGFKKIEIKDPKRIFINQVRMSQNVNSQVSRTNVKSLFYKTFLQDGEEKHLLSCNRDPERDMESLEKIAKDLAIELTKNY
ncbi:MAG: hypothetical protein AAF391_01600 [Bacteroidota bacterium]